MNIEKNHRRIWRINQPQFVLILQKNIFLLYLKSSYWILQSYIYIDKINKDDVNNSKKSEVAIPYGYTKIVEKAFYECLSLQVLQFQIV